MQPAKTNHHGFEMLAPVVRFARKKLRGAGEAESAAARHAEYYCALAESLRTLGVETWHAAGRRFDAERGNFGLALAWARDHRRYALGARLVTALQRFWSVRGAVDEALHWMDPLIVDHARVEDALLRCRLLEAATGAYARSGQLARMRDCGRIALEIARTFQDRNCLVYGLLAGALAELSSGNHDAAGDLLLEALAPAGTEPDDALLALVWQRIGVCYDAQHRFARASQAHETAARFARRAGDEYCLAVALGNRGYSLLQVKQYERARRALLEAKDLAEVLDQPFLRFINRCTLCELEFAQGNLDAARRELLAAFEFGTAAYEPVYHAMTLDWAGHYLTLAGRFREAVMVYGLASAVGKGLKQSLSSLTVPQSRTDLPRLVCELRADEYASAWKSGRLLSDREILEMLV